MTTAIGWRIAGLAVALAPVAASASPATVARGERLARSYCAACHAIGRDGASPNPAAPRFRDLPAFDPKRNLDEIVAEALMTDHPPMPQFMPGPEEINDLTDYLRSIQTTGEPVSRP